MVPVAEVVLGKRRILELVTSTTEPRPGTLAGKRQLSSPRFCPLR
jgi:hypothetical protein